MKHIRLESIRLSDGRLLEISKYGRKYGVMLGGLELMEKPELWSNRTKANAYAIYEVILRKDVMEIS